MAHRQTLMRDSSTLTVLGEITFIPLDGELPALSHCEANPKSPTLQYYRNSEPSRGTEDVDGEWVCGCRLRGGGGGRRGSREGGVRTGKETSQAVKTGLRAVLGAWRGRHGALRFDAVSVRPNPGSWGRTQRHGGRGRGRIQKQKYASLLLVCLSKEKFNWNCLIFKRNIQDLIITWGLFSPEGQVRERLLGCHHPESPRRLGYGLPFSFWVANAVRLSEWSIQVNGFFFPFYIIII